MTIRARTNLRKTHVICNDFIINARLYPVCQACDQSKLFGQLKRSDVPSHAGFSHELNSDAGKSQELNGLSHKANKFYLQMTDVEKQLNIIKGVLEDLTVMLSNNIFSESSKVNGSSSVAEFKNNTVVTSSASAISYAGVVSLTK